VSQEELMLTYNGRILRQCYKPDFVCHQKIVVELKAVTAIADEHRTQLHNYSRATGFRLGMLVNFSHYPQLQHERIIL
jgi:GxxExxY protein